MSQYQGPATLIASDGTETQVDVALTIGRRGHLKEWHGQCIIGVDQHLGLETYTIRLPNGREGQVLVSNVQYGAGGVAVTLAGSGKPPFDEG